MDVLRLRIRALGLIFLVAILPGVDEAAGASAEAFAPNRGHTVAVLPFRFAVGKGLGGLRADTDPDEAAALVREQVTANLRRGPWRLLELNQVDAVLAGRGWGEPEALERAGPRPVGQALGTELLFYGEVTHWGRHYMLIHSQAEVGADVRLVSARTGKVVWSNSGKKVRTAGLTKIPTGIGSAVITPFLGMRKAFLFEITNELARELTASLVYGAGEAPAAAAPPKLLVTSAQAGSDGLVEPGDRITVVAIGQPDLTATFSVGPERRDLPMTEFGPGRYVGAYEVAPGDRFTNAPITVNLFTRAGGLTSATLFSPIVSTRP